MYEVNAPDIIFEYMDCNLIVIDGVEGLYYASGGTGAEVFRALEAGYGEDEICAALKNAGAGFDADRAVRQFIRQLVDYRILREAPGRKAPGDFPPFPADGMDQPPAITRFDDLQELLLIDPIHQVDVGEGWPFVK